MARQMVQVAGNNSRLRSCSTSSMLRNGSRGYLMINWRGMMGCSLMALQHSLRLFVYCLGKSWRGKYPRHDRNLEV